MDTIKFIKYCSIFQIGVCIESLIRVGYSPFPIFLIGVYCIQLLGIAKYSKA